MGNTEWPGMESSHEILIGLVEDTTSRSREPIEDETLELDEIREFQVSSVRCG